MMGGRAVSKCIIDGIGSAWAWGGGGMADAADLKSPRNDQKTPENQGFFG